MFPHEDAYHQKPKKAHGRIEERTVEVYHVLPILKFLIEWFKYIACIIKVTRKRDVWDKKKKQYKSSTTISFYISTKLLTAKDAYSLIRAHWFIENGNHYVKDVSFQEDLSRIRKNPFNFACIRSLALNILRINKFDNITEARYEHTLDFLKVFNLIGIDQY